MIKWPNLAPGATAVPQAVAAERRLLALYSGAQTTYLLSSPAMLARQH